MFGVPQQNSNAVTFNTAPKAFRKNSENMSSSEIQEYINQFKICPLQDFSTMQNIRMQYELYEGLHESKGTKAAAM